MRRRDFIKAAGCSVAVWSYPAHAQRSERTRRVGVLMAVSERDPVGHGRLSTFRQELAKLGWSEGRNLQLELRWAAGDPALVRRNAAELVALAPDLIFAQGTPNVAASEERNAVDSDRVRGGERSGGPRLRGKHGAPGRQHHRLFVSRVLDGRQVAGDAEAGLAGNGADCRDVQSRNLSLLCHSSSLVRDRCARCSRST